MEPRAARARCLGDPRASTQHPALKPTDLVGALVLSSGAMTNRVDNIEAAGLVECQVVDEALLAHLANEERLLSGLSAGERKQLTDLLTSCSCPGHSLGCVQLAPARVTSESPPRRRRARRPRRR